MIKRLKPPKNCLKIDFNLDLVVMCSEKIGTFDEIHLFLFQDIALFLFQPILGEDTFFVQKGSN